MPDWIIRALAGVGLVAALWLHGCHYGKGAESDAHEATKTAHRAVLADLAEKTKVAAEKARAAGAALKRERGQNDRQEKERADASNREIVELRRRLRDGSVSLHPWWSCGLPGTAASDPSGLAGGEAAAADLRAEGALGLVADADAADRWVEWLQFELVATRKAVIEAGCAVEPSP